MTGNNAKQRSRRTTLNTRVFKKVFAFKQKQPSHPSGASPTPAERTHANKTSSAGDCGFSSPDDETSSCASTVDTEGVLIFPTAQRLTASSPPAAILDRISGAKNGDNKQRRGDVFLSFGRRSRTSPAPLLGPRSPYQSKRTRKNLSATLRANGEELSHHSPWERRYQYPASESTRSMDLSFSTSKEVGIVEELQAINESMDTATRVVQTTSSNSSILPPEVSPAFRFVPIGCEEDDDCSMSSVDDVDQSTTATTAVITRIPAAHGSNNTSVAQSAAIDPSAAAATIVKTASGTGSTSNPCRDVNACSSNESESGNDGGNDKYSPASGEEAHASRDESDTSRAATWRQLPPSLAPTEDTPSRDSPGLLIKGLGSPARDADPRYNIDSYCVALEDHHVEDWFPTLREEIMKLSTIFTGHCGAASADTI